MEDTDDLSPGSLVRRWRLGKQLRELREAAGRSQDDAAAYLGVRRPTISRIENGRHAILPKNVRFLCQLYEIGSPLVDTLIRQAEESNERGWWVAYSDTMPNWFETYVGFEADAQEIRTYQSELVPGLLQHPSYTRAMRSVYGAVNEAALEKSVEFRLARQRRFEARSPTYRVVLNEAVVRRPVGEMKAQLNHLIEVSRREFVAIQVLPYEVGPHLGMNGPFSLITLPDERSPNFVYLEHEDGALYLERPADLDRYTGKFETISAMALSPDDTRDFLDSLKSV